jgi:hypothetical protein
MDNNTSGLAILPSINELSFSYEAVAGNRITYYVAAAALIITVWSLQPKKKAPQIEVPFYKASKLKWIFDAETLIKHSYHKVRCPPLLPELAIDHLSVQRCNLPDQGHRRHPGTGSSQVHR